MPIAKIQLPDGRIGRFEVPEGTTQDQVLQFVHQSINGQNPEIAKVLQKERTDQQSLTPDEKASLVEYRKSGQLAKINAMTPEEAGQSQVEDMSRFEKFGIGMGKGFSDIGRGVSQLTGFGDQALIDDAKQRDKALNTGYGTAGNITSKVVSALPTMFIPGANSLVGASLIGGGLGASEPVATGESRLVNTGIGALGGLGGQVAGRVLTAGVKGIKALIDPLRQKGQEQIAAKTLQEFAGNPEEAAKALSSARELVPGSAPTAAEASGDAGIAQLQRALVNQNPKLASEIAERTLDQNAARQTALKEITKYGGNLDSAVGRRAAAGEKLYEKAFGQKLVVDDTIKSLTSRPSFQNALERAQRIANEQGQPINNLFDQSGKFASTRALHYVKMGFDDLINDSANSGIGKTELNAIKATRGKLLDWIAEKNPYYNSARIRFEKMSRPINRQQIVDEITSRATKSQLPNVRGHYTIYPDAFAKTLKDEGSAVVKAATGREAKGLSDVLTGDQMKTLLNIKSDLGRNVVARDLGRAVGSNTAQNLASQNLLRQVLGPTGLPQSWAEGALLKTIIGRPAQWASKLGEEKIQDVLSRAMLDPKYAAGLLAKAKPAERTKLQGLLVQSLANPANSIGAQAGLGFYGLLNQQ
jgi:hypothetical protein